MGSEMCIRDRHDPNIILHHRDAEQRSDAAGKHGMPFGHSSDTHLMFEHRTEVNGWLSVTPQSFSKVNNGQVRIFDRNKYGPVHPTITQN